MAHRVQKLFTYADIFICKSLKPGKNINDFGWPISIFSVPQAPPQPAPPPAPPPAAPKVLKKRIEFSAHHIRVSPKK